MSRGSARRGPLWAALLAVMGLTWLAPSALMRLDLLAYDLLMPSYQPSRNGAVVLAIDDESLAALGRWPWSRAVHARLVDTLHDAGVPVIGMTILFSETDDSGDGLLAEALSRHGAVVLPVAPVQMAQTDIMDGVPSRRLGDAVARLGHVDAEIDLDGQVREIYLMAGTGEAKYPAMALALYQLAKPDTAQGPWPGLRAAVGAQSERSRYAWLRDHRVLLPRGAPAEQLSVTRILQTPELAQSLRGRVVLIGVTASGLGGELVSPIGGDRTAMPSVQLHARAFNALQDQQLITPAGPGAQLALALLMATCVVAWAGRPRQRQIWWVAATCLLPLLTSALVLQGLRIWVAPIISTFALLAAALAWLALYQRDNRRRLARSRQHSLATLEAIGDGVITVNRQAIIRYANPVALRQIDNGGLVGHALDEVIRLEANGLAMLGSAVEECLHLAQEVRPAHLLSLPGPDGASRSVRASVSPLHDPDFRLEGAVIVLADVTDAVASASRLQFAATHDALTGLPNRVLLQDRLGLALARAQRLGSSVAILFLDLDRFKRINDSLGHTIGDEVLKVTARRLAAICRSTDFVVRWGGDEFVVVMEDASGAESVAVAAAKLVGALGEDVETNGMRLASSCSVGIVLAPQDGKDIEDLLAKADTAMYRAKSHPDTGFHFYSSELKVWTRERLRIEVELRQALREGLFELHYQPQFLLAGGALVGFEALLRWHRAPDVMVQPVDFIGVAEESGLIVEIGAWVVWRVTQDIARWLADGHKAMPVAVNVSARQCVNRNIVDVVHSALRDSCIPPALLKLEITETTAMTDAARVIELLEEISSLGVRIAVDDFGTGYSSLAYLKRFPISELKIDRSFVQDVATDADDAAIVRATIALAHELGILVVAEGVENQAQSSFLAAQNCDIVQGFLFGKPQPLGQTTPLL